MTDRRPFYRDRLPDPYPEVFPEGYGLSESSIREYTVAPPVSLLEAHREPERWEVERDREERDDDPNARYHDGRTY